ncbi:MAG: type I-MYXAN CRISPR-associated protein Cas6/Cmx6 [Proteobacteria bacterium]|nr:MAG: type I-MYXAN CRISPR-associated protein Cas6/Cmx6 [Pseudomonadota bacterium]
MFWQETKPENEEYRVPGDVVDLGFRVRCSRLPVDHAWALCKAIHHVLPWLPDEARAGVHLIHGAESGNGWQRPDDTDYLILSRRTRLNLRVPASRRNSAMTLCGARIEIDDCVLEVGEAAEKSLIPSTTVFSRHVRTQAEGDEPSFLQETARELTALGIEPRKMMCGRLHAFRSPDGPVYTRSVMIADLRLDESILLQQRGIGDLCAYGMGLFLPHKGIDAVYRKTDE